MTKTRNTRRNHEFDVACGKVLKELRYFSNLTQDELAEKVGVSQAQWSSYEKGVSRLTLDALITISEALDINPMVSAAMIIDRIKFEDSVFWLSIDDYITIFKAVDIHRKERVKKKIEYFKKLLEGHL